MLPWLAHPTERANKKAPTFPPGLGPLITRAGEPSHSRLYLSRGRLAWAKRISKLRSCGIISSASHGAQRDFLAKRTAGEPHQRHIVWRPKNPAGAILAPS